MHVGHYISGAAHLSFFLWLVVGDVFTSKPNEISITTISIVSADQFEKELNIDSTPQVSDEIDIINQIEPDQVTKNPTVSKIDTEVSTISPKVPNIPQLQEDNPEILEQTQSPNPEVFNEPEQPSLSEDDQSLVPIPEISETPAPIIAERVAPIPVAPQTEDIFNDNLKDNSIKSPNEKGEEELKLDENRNLTRGATTEIITEPKKKPSGAPKKSLRPKVRPSRQSAQNDTDLEIRDDIASAVSSAITEVKTKPEPGNGTKTFAATALEAGKALHSQIWPCWPVDVGNQNAYVTVSVSFSLNKMGKVERDVINLVGSDGGNPELVKSAFLNAKRAIFKCQKRRNGFDLSNFDYETWKEVEISFNPDEMRNR
tara:strand:+ start:271 stop:1383 length:1113 start_codon:yes stop_codon:yes gene_type:complete